MTDDREETKRIFAKNLNKYIALNQKQQIDVAKDLNEKPTTLNMWCKGNSLPGTGKLRKIADYFNIGMTDLIEEKQFEDTDDEYSDIVMKIGLHDERFKKFIIKYDKLSTDNANSANLFINGRQNKIALEPKIFNYASYTSEILNLTNNSYYVLRQVHKLTINPPSTPTVAADTIWITFADEGVIELAFPTTVKYIGKIPTVNNGETWEITIINKVVSIQKVGEGA